MLAEYKEEIYENMGELFNHWCSKGHFPKETLLHGRLSDFLNTTEFLSDVNNFLDVLVDGIRNNKRIGIIGDYDVDGATSTSSFIRYFKMIGYDKYNFLINQRMSDGYGANPKVVERLVNNFTPDIMLVLDSGACAFDAFKHARKHGMKSLIIDHHETHISGERPDGIMINPKKPEDNDKHLDNLCTAGISFLTILFLNEHLGRPIKAKDIFDNILPLTILGTIADLVPLTGVNYYLIRHYASTLTNNPAIKKMCPKLPNIHNVVSLCGWQVAPKINACGRIDNSEIGTEALISDNPDKWVTKMKRINAKRKEIGDKIKQAVISAPSNNEPITILGDFNWHKGVIGIAASLAVDLTNKPAILFGCHGSGSARSQKWFNFGKFLQQAVKDGVLSAGGGHAMAAGATLNMDNGFISGLTAFKEYTSIYFKKHDFDKTITRTINFSYSLGQFNHISAEEWLKYDPMPLPLVEIYNVVIDDVNQIGKRPAQYIISDGNETLKVSNWDKPESPQYKEIEMLRSNQEAVNIIVKPKLNDFFSKGDNLILDVELVDVIC